MARGFTLNSLVKGVGVEIREMSVVGVFLAAMIPGYLWVRKAATSNEVIGRTAIVGAALFGAAVAEGIRRRK